jgi:two-component system sensor histidine kinase BaeS
MRLPDLRLLAANRIMKSPFRIGIAFKLFCALLGAGIVMATAMGVASRISFQRGFLGYLNEIETQRLGVLTTVLADVYRERIAAGAAAGDAWAFLQGQEDEWRRIVRASDRSFRAAADAEGRAEGAANIVPGAPGAPAASARPAVAGPALPTTAAQPGAATEVARGSRGEPLRRTTLLDADRRLVAGNPHPSSDAMVGPIVVDGSVVGWVASVPFRELTNAADLSFQQRQTAAAWYIAGLAVLLAGLIAWGLGRIFLAPARRLAAAIHQLAAGRFDTRVSVTSSDELGTLAADFNRLANTLERNENLRREFMADVSHELRTPLAIMRGELEAMEDGLQPLDSRSIQSLQSEVAVLSKLVDDIHQLSIADVGSLSYQRVEFDAVALLEQAVEAFRDRLQARGMSAVLHKPAEPLPVLGDPERLQQVFHNILENAARYADDGARLRIECRRQGGEVEIGFHDSGPGVADENLARLFERFYRVEGSRNRATGGSGLGLAICQSIVTAHEGSLAASRSPLGGLALTLRLPVAAATSDKKA